MKLRILILSLPFLSLPLFADSVADPGMNPPAELALQEVAPTDWAGKSLADIYRLPLPQVEEKVMQRLKQACADTTSSVGLGAKDPAKLTPAELCAVQHYSGSGYSVNRKLWEAKEDGKSLNGDDWAYVRVLDSALKKIKSEPLTTVYRGTSIREVAFSKPGEIVRLKGYSSTSPKQSVAEEFVRDRMMVIKARSGKNLKIYSNAGMESEYLLPRSTRVRFDRKEVRAVEIFTDDGPEKRKIEFIYVTEVN